MCKNIYKEEMNTLTKMLDCWYNQIFSTRFCILFSLMFLKKWLNVLEYIICLFICQEVTENIQR